MTTYPSFDDTTDAQNADRGFIEALDPCVIKNADGRVVWDNDVYAFLDADCPDTVNPSLWRQAQLCSRQGLYKVAEGVYQVRGLDISNMTLVEGEKGVIVVDPLISVETAAAALALYRKNRGDRPVTGLIYTHSHVDHFGGSRGVLPQGTEAGVPIVAPAGFLEHAVSENVYAGTAMTRRSMYQYGMLLPKAPDGQVSLGLGQATSSGVVSLIAPTADITETGQEETIDGVRIVFQMTPGTEAPSEMNFLFPAQRTLCLAENATHNMHNILTLRGAVVRDAREWSRYLDEAIDYFAGQYDVALASHHWPTWGEENVAEFLAQQRDLYAYMHDQTLRLLNDGQIGVEIAEELELPPALEKSWHARGYYGSLSHNVKAIYQRYLGWYTGNPAQLWELPPVEQAKRYVDLAGGAEAARAKAEQYADSGDLRFAATLLNHVVFADPSDAAAKQALADVYTELGQGAENGTWRNAYLTGAWELRKGTDPETPLTLSSPEVIAALTVEQLIDTVAVRIDGPRAAAEDITIDLAFTDLKRRHRMTLHNGALTHRSYPIEEPAKSPAGLTITLTRPQFLSLLAGKVEDGMKDDGDPKLLGKLFSYLSKATPMFPVVTP